MREQFARAFYSSRAWARCRRAYASSVGGLCEDCLAQGVYTPGEQVHHMTPLTPDNIDDPSVTLDWRNLRLLCKPCHDKLLSNPLTILTLRRKERLECLMRKISYLIN